MSEGLRERMQEMRTQKPTKSQRRLLEYFSHSDARRISHYSISEIAGELDMADATVLRFCRALGYEGYRDFRTALAAESFSSGAEGYLSGLAAHFTEVLHTCSAFFDEGKLEAAANMIKAARMVCCLGMGASFCAAMAMHERLLGLGVASFCERDSTLCELFISSRGATDLLLVFGNDPHIERCAALARARGMRVVAVAGERLWMRCDLVLAKTSEPDRATELFAVEALCMSLDRVLRELP